MHCVDGRVLARLLSRLKREEVVDLKVLVVGLWKERGKGGMFVEFMRGIEEVLVFIGGHGVLEGGFGFELELGM